MSTNHILVDSAGFVAWFFRQDQNHSRAVQQFKQIEQEGLLPITTNVVIDESATVLSHRVGQTLAREFLDFAAQLPTIFVTEELRAETLTLFRAQERKGTSVVDCSNIVVMQRFDIPLILSFDAVFSKDFHVQVVP
jgi:predicted nucleic acid-binding protein